MHTILGLIAKHNLTEKSQAELDDMKNGIAPIIGSSESKLYVNSFFTHEGVFYCIGKHDEAKHFVLASKEAIHTKLTGPDFVEHGLNGVSVDMTYENYIVLKDIFPFIAPVSLRERKTTFGCGDRLGRASAAHIRIAKQYEVAPVLAQQSIRELALTKRTFHNVVADTAFMVFQEGYTAGYGADGDHLKTMADIDVALEIGMPMVTLDLTDVMKPEVAEYSDAQIEDGFSKLSSAEQSRILDAYGDSSFSIADDTILISAHDAKLCALMYGDAVRFTKEVDTHLRNARGDEYDLEVSIDETTTPTLPAHHLYIIKELNHLGVTVNSLAPRFIGEFQKGIDYIGDLTEFERQFRVHAEIAQTNGDYKVSIHSGSDKFSVFPTIGKYTNMRLHAKTAGTNWLEALRTIAMKDPQLYRKIHTKAFAHLDDALKLYHITADFGKIAPLESVADADLPNYLEHNEARQLLHITYGGLLNDPEIRTPFFVALSKHEDTYYERIQTHIGKHFDKLGIPKR